jgi:ABC-2 type transport system permease protein
MAGITAAPPQTSADRFVLRPATLRALIWLRWRLLTRNYARSPRSIIGATVLIIVLLPLIGLLTAGLVAIFDVLQPDHLYLATNVLFYVLTAAYLFWAISPLMQFTLNEGLDVTKLTTYPVSQAEMMVGLIIATLLDIPTIGLLIVFVGIGISWAHSPPQIALIVLALILAYVNIIGLSQLMLSALLGLLRSRRWRDMTVVFASLFSISCYLLSQVFARVTPSDISTYQSFLSFDIGRYLQFIPPGMVGRAIAAISTGDYAGSALWLVALAVFGFVVVWGWSAVLARSLATPEDSGGRAIRRRRSTADESAALPTGSVTPAQTAATAGNQLIPASALAIVVKDLRYIQREPLYKRYLIGAAYWIVILILPSIGSFQQRSYPGYHPFNATGFIFFAPVFLMLALSANAFGFEGPAFSTLALFPVRAVNLFLGKNLAVFALGLAEGVILLGVWGGVTQQWAAVPVNLIGMIGMLLVALGLSNIITVLLPNRVLRSSMRPGSQQQDAGAGCTTGLIRAAATFGVLALALPIEGAIYIPQWVGHPELTIVLLPIALIYCVGMYIGGTAIAAGQYYNRVPEIINAVVRE